MEQQKKTGSEVKRRDNSRIWLVLILLLFFITLITSSLVGYILGSNAGPSSMGQLIDTILLTPESTDSRTMIHLSGIVAYTDGTPAAGRRLELHSEPITTVSDSKGGFLFPNVPQGEHTISILTDEGEVQVQRKINIQYDSRKEKDVSIQLTENGAYAIELSIDVRVLEVVIELDQESMRIDSESFTFSTRDGDVVTPTGSANVRDGVIVTPGGNVHLPDGNVVFPGGKTDDTAYIILSDDTVIEKQPIASGDIKVDADGAVSLPDGTVIEPGGKIINPDGTAELPGASGVVVGDGIVSPIGSGTSKQPETESEAGSDTSAPSSEEIGRPGASDRFPEISESPEESSSKNSAGQSDTEEPENPTEPTFPADQVMPSKPSGSGNSSDSDRDSVKPEKPEEPTQPDGGVLDVSGQTTDGSYAQWTQNCTIDLFSNRTGGEQNKIAPGSSGYYLFRLQNTRRTPLNATVTMSEGDGLHLPLSFTLTPLDNAGNKQTKRSVSGTLQRNGTDLRLNTEISAESSELYRLDWIWPPEGNDSEDTRIGSGTEHTYILNMKIHAEES